MRSFRLPLLNPAGSRDCAVLALAPNVFVPSQLQDLALSLRADRNVESNAAAQFTSANSEALAVASNATLQIDDVNTSMTIGGWFYFDAHTGDRALICKGAYNTFTLSEYALYVRNTNTLRFEIGTLDELTIPKATATVPTDGAWHFIVGRYDADNDLLRLQVDGVDSTPVAHSGGIKTGTYEFTHGRRSASSTLGFYDGRMDSTFFSKQHLTDAELTALYNSGSGVTSQDLGVGSVPAASRFISWWDHDEASGTHSDAIGSNNLTNENTVTQIAGIASGAAVDEDTASLWLDQSTADNDATQGSAAKRPTFQAGVVAGKPVLTFDGSDDILHIGSLALGTDDFLIAWVEGYTANPADSIVLTESGAANDFIRHDDSTHLTVGNATGPATSQITHAAISSGHHISMLARESGVMTYYLDGTSHALGTFTADWSFDRIGELQGDLAEIVVVAGRNPLDSQRNQLGRYLARQYFLTWSP